MAGCVGSNPFVEKIEEKIYIFFPPRIDTRTLGFPAFSLVSVPTKSIPTLPVVVSTSVQAKIRIFLKL
jgi:hypothetical protein